MTVHCNIIALTWSCLHDKLNRVIIVIYFLFYRV